MFIIAIQMTMDEIFCYYNFSTLANEYKYRIYINSLSIQSAFQSYFSVFGARLQRNKQSSAPQILMNQMVWMAMSGKKLWMSVMSCLTKIKCFVIINLFMWCEWMRTPRLICVWFWHTAHTFHITHMQDGTYTANTQIQVANWNSTNNKSHRQATKTKIHQQNSYINHWVLYLFGFCYGIVYSGIT